MSGDVKTLQQCNSVPPTSCGELMQANYSGFLQSKKTKSVYVH